METKTSVRQYSCANVIDENDRTKFHETLALERRIEQAQEGWPGAGPLRVPLDGLAYGDAPDLVEAS